MTPPARDPDDSGLWPAMTAATVLWIVLIPTAAHGTGRSWSEVLQILYIWVEKKRHHLLMLKELKYSHH